MNGNQIIIGGASGYLGEASFDSSQLLKVEGLNFFVFDYLAELTMPILARARAKNSSKCYTTDFLTGALKIIESSTKTGHESARNLATYWAGQVVGLTKQVKSTMTVV